MGMCSLLAVWAVSELASPDQLRSMAQDYLSDETDKTVAVEWAHVGFQSPVPER